MIAHEVGHIVISRRYRSDALNLGVALSKSLPYEVDPGWPEEFAADIIGTELALGAWFYGDFMQLLERYRVRGHRDYGADLSAYYAGICLFLEFLWIVEERAFRTRQTPLFLSHPSAAFRKFAITAPIANGLRARHPMGGEILFEQAEVLRLFNGIYPIVELIAEKVLGPDYVPPSKM
jgi:hypothetical protein